MAAIQFGTTFRSPREVAPMARKIESLGFDVLGCGEHVTFHGDTANSFISLSVAAGATERIRLMNAIALVPLYPPALLAKLGAALDVASDGRFMLGVGVGGEYPKEFEACGVPVRERGARTNEALEVLERVWTQSDVSFDGKFTQLDAFTLKPLPLQKPRPPIWISGRTDAAMRRAARYGDGWLPYMYTPERLAESIDKIRGFAEDSERDLTDFTPGLYIFTTVHEDSKTAVDMATTRLGRQYAQDFTKLVSKYALAGTPDEVSTRLGEYVDAGARFVILSAACPDEYVEENVTLIAESVMPGFRQG